MFKLVGREVFDIGKAKAAITIETLGTFAYEYTLEVNGKSYQKFTEQQSKNLETWIHTLDGIPTRICFGSNTIKPRI